LGWRDRALRLRSQWHEQHPPPMAGVTRVREPHHGPALTLPPPCALPFRSVLKGREAGERKWGPKQQSGLGGTESR
jgi:hypothetical protein